MRDRNYMTSESETIDKLYESYRMTYESYKIAFQALEVIASGSGEEKETAQKAIKEIIDFNLNPPNTTKQRDR